VTGDPRLWWLAGADAVEIAAQLDRVDDGSPPVPPADAGPGRLGIVDPDERKLRLARRLLQEGGPWRGRSDIWYSPAGLVGRGGKVAFLFPGVEPTFGLDVVDLPALGARFGLVAPRIEDDSVAHRTASIYRTGNFLDEVVREIGIVPDLIAGHSIGEWSGSVASGIVPVPHAEDLLEVVDPATVELPDLDFAAFAAGVGPVAEVVAELHDIVVSHDNAPGQAIVCGTPAMVEEALARLRARNVLGYRLGFQSGFHTPVMEHSLPEFRAHLERMEVRPATIPMWSATSVAPYPDTAEEIIELHLRHLTEPVRFRPLVDRLYEDAGARVFVQVGVGSLTSFVSDTLGERDHATVALLTPRRTALAQVHRALTALWVEGVDVRPDALRPSAGPVAARAGSAPVAARPAPAPPAALVPGANGARGSVALAPPMPLAAAAAMLATAARAGQDVLDALSARLRLTITPPVRPAASEPAAPAAVEQAPPGPDDEILPWAPTPPHPWPAERTTVRRLLSLETMPETYDHTLYPAPDGWPDEADRFPIVAMTTQLQLLEDIAASYGGGRDVVELFGVRNFRWLDIAEPLDLEITVVPKGDDVLSIALGPYCRANVRLGRFPAERPRHDARPLVNERPAAHTAQEIFDLRLMFHGPAYQGVSWLGPVGDDGMQGDFDALPTPGSLLDDLGKLIAYWAIDKGGIGEAALPSGVTSVELYAPKPVRGEPVTCDIRIVELQRDAIKADGVLVLDDGTLLARVTGWTSILFHLDELMEPLHHAPSLNDAAEPQPGGWYVIRERWPTGPARDLTSRRYLARPERARYAAMNLLEQRQWLLDTVAAKDAVRSWLREEHAVPSFPVELQLVPDGDRRYRVRSELIPAGHDPRVTIARLGWVTVAVLGDGAYRDIEARLVSDAADAEGAARLAAAALAARNPGARVDSVPRPTVDVPSRLEVPDPPPFAVAWTG
jgi:malonyl CoA-acyl carrier protein transacylase